MTQRERIRDDDQVESKVGMYDTGARRASTRQQPVATQNMPYYDDDAEIEVVAPTDSVRWGPILAGLFAALSTLAVLSVLGLAVGLGSYDAGDAAGNFGLGAGIWGAISALIAFGVGGWLAARTAAVHGHSNGLLNGAMVWAVAIPLLLYMLGGGIGSVLRTAGSAASTAAQVAAPIAGQAAGAAADDPALQATAQAGGQDVTAAVQATAQALGNQVTPERVEQATGTASRAAWGTLLSLLLGLGAAALGGYMGAQDRTQVRSARVA